MRLKKLQVSGFKSFVDSTDIRLPANLVAVVGPNGCGKSNVIDAVRWVMGEASAKMLRGDSMTDVIFNGSTTRKPVGKAAVELLFDNSDGSAGGSFAKFSEISVKRTLSRDGNSSYFINRIKTRRKDVLDLFRGTGLGPRSYSIIEQGMVSRIIEARPDDMRLFVEEAAGTLKYKERRRETETRISHTRENLQRVADIRDQLAKQLRRLKRQANAAKRYRTLKDEHRLMNGQLWMLRLSAMNDKLAKQDRLSAEHENKLESARTAQRAGETEMEKLRQQQADAQQQHNQVQQERYQLEAELTNLEQRINDLSKSKQRQEQEKQRLRAAQQEQQQQLESDQARLAQLQAEQTTFAPQLEEEASRRRQADEQLAAAERQLENWQLEWERFNEQSQTPARQQEVQQSRIAQFQQHLQRSTEQRARLEQELTDTRQLLAAMDIQLMRAEVKRHDETCEQRELELQQTEQALQAVQQAVQLKRDENAELCAKQNQAQSRLSSLRQIQAAALGGDDQALQNWLADSGLDKQPKLAERIRVADGWEAAVDRLMNGFLGAVCVAQLPAHALRKRPDCAFTLVADGAKPAAVADTNAGPESVRLLAKVEAGTTDLSAFLGGVYVAESITEALAKQYKLGSRECVVTREGVLLGANWIAFASQSQLETGVLVREEEMSQLQNSLRAIDQQAASVEHEVAQLDKQCETHLQAGQQQRSALNQLRHGATEMHSNLAREEARCLEAEQRSAALAGEIDNLNAHAHNDEREINAAQELLRAAADQRDGVAAKRDELLKQKAQYQNAVLVGKQQLHQAGEQVHQQALQQQRLEAELASTAAGIARAERQLDDVNAQLTQLTEATNEGDPPATALQAELQRKLEHRVEVGRRLSEASDCMTEWEGAMQNLMAQQSSHAAAVREAQEVLNQHNLSRQETAVRRDTQAEQMDGEGYDQQSLRAQMPAQADREAWELKCAELQDKIDRIGAVNLLAIDEFDEQSERKEYLDKQSADLTEALDTLRDVMRKIDLETRARFQETFERLNVGFKDFFPKLFGGGKVELQLTSDDLLTAGVVVMARPPGKRNSHIHLLSGGEKALTAVALLFALFQLNPAPFCMLDEVDAPLDDANVERYCRTLKAMVKVSQMIMITHNKITMEAADILVGVTMSEPGVSRLVSVDIEQASAMAAQS